MIKALLSDLSWPMALGEILLVRDKNPAWTPGLDNPPNIIKINLKSKSIEYFGVDSFTDSYDKKVWFRDIYPYFSHNIIAIATAAGSRESMNMWVFNQCLYACDDGKTNTKIKPYWFLYNNSGKILALLDPTSKELKPQCKMEQLLAILNQPFVIILRPGETFIYPNFKVCYNPLDKSGGIKMYDANNNIFSIHEKSGQCIYSRLSEQILQHATQILQKTEVEAIAAEKEQQKKIELQKKIIEDALKEIKNDIDYEKLKDEFSDIFEYIKIKEISFEDEENDYCWLQIEIKDHDGIFYSPIAGFDQKAIWLPSEMFIKY